MLKQLKRDASKLKNNLEKKWQLEEENKNLKHECKLQGVVVTHKETEWNSVDNKLKKLEADHKRKKEQHKFEIETVNNTIGMLLG